MAQQLFPYVGVSAGKLPHLFASILSLQVLAATLSKAEPIRNPSSYTTLRTHISSDRQESRQCLNATIRVDQITTVDCPISADDTAQELQFNTLMNTICINDYNGRDFLDKLSETEAKFAEETLSIVNSCQRLFIANIDMCTGQAATARRVEIVQMIRLKELVSYANYRKKAVASDEFTIELSGGAGRVGNMLMNSEGDAEAAEQIDIMLESFVENAKKRLPPKIDAATKFSLPTPASGGTCK